jgi:hypothetical protein
MNSLSILAYLKVAEHITGDTKYAKAARTLIDRHSYETNAMIVKTHLGPGAGNQSDDEMMIGYYEVVWLDEPKSAAAPAESKVVN